MRWAYLSRNDTAPRMGISHQVIIIQKQKDFVTVVGQVIYQHRHDRMRMDQGGFQHWTDRRFAQPHPGARACQTACCSSNPIEPKLRSVMNVWSPNPNCRRNDDRRGLPPPTRMSAATVSASLPRISATTTVVSGFPKRFQRSVDGAPLPHQFGDATGQRWP
jgi:hypothetical protein